MVFPSVQLGHVEDRPSERPTAPTLPPPAPGSSDTGVVELSMSALESLRDLEPQTPFAVAISDVPPKPRSWIVPLAAAGWGLFGVAVVVGLATSGTAPPPRAPNAAAADRQPLVFARDEASIAPPAGGCAPSGPARVVASKARVATGVDVSVVENGFGLGYAEAASEASAVVVEGPGLRVAERLRVRGAGEVTRVAVDTSADDLALRVDGAVPASEGAVRFVTYAGWIHAMRASNSGRALWPAPNATRGGFVRLGKSRALPPPEVLRAAPRDDGGAVVVMKSAGGLHVGSVDGELAPTGPLVAIPRAGATLGTPQVAAFGGGAVVAWAERAAGASAFDVHVATVTEEDGVRETTIAPGLSPSVTALPDGDVLLAWTSGSSGAHRVLVQRLGRDLAARGEPVLVSPEDLNAGQPAAAVRADGRGVVAFFVAGKGNASLLAAPVACDPGL